MFWLRSNEFEKTILELILEETVHISRYEFAFQMQTAVG